LQKFEEKEKQENAASAAKNHKAVTGGGRFKATKNETLPSKTGERVAPPAPKPPKEKREKPVKVRLVHSTYLVCR